ncbi:MAG TPA: phytoene/squalene synthase family protein, partial [Myxococcota bacterium]|nr:phytoene/squalene synthase family protein [Myxococcota bacterium]
MTAVVVAGAAVHDAALDTLARGSRTFWLASLFLPTDRRLDAAVLYALCRRVDDTADDAASPTEAWAGLAALDAWIDRGGDPTCDAAREVMARRRIDPQLAHELVEGVRSDTGLVRVANDRELLRYCYRVASTVGLMMCGVLGVTDPAALPFAIDLGVAMQLTNIARDVAEDARLGRVYLPADRLRALGAGVEPAEVLASREPVRRVVADLLALADRYYASADHGMRAIP